MKKAVLIFMALVASAFAQVEQIRATPEVVASLPVIVDIRREDEWISSGVIDGAITITFFDDKGKFDIDKFEKELSLHVEKGQKIALICRSGARSLNAAKILDKKGYDVINLDGGMMGLQRSGYKAVLYKK